MKVNIKNCSVEDQFNLVIKLFGGHFVTMKKYEEFAKKVQQDLILSPEGWALVLQKFGK